MIINWSPTPTEEVVQCVRCLVATGTGTVPLARALGTPQDVVDLPQSVAGARLQADVVRAVRTYEPRVRVARVRLANDADGKLQATVELDTP